LFSSTIGCTEAGIILLGSALDKHQTLPHCKPVAQIWPPSWPVAAQAHGETAGNRRWFLKCAMSGTLQYILTWLRWDHRAVRGDATIFCAITAGSP
jgi:hypothetical protein